MLLETLPTKNVELSNISRLPKVKIVLDYVLNKLSQQISQQSYELFSDLLTMYRTSVGFDPNALSKGRYKRIKSSDFKQLVQSINLELGNILNSTEYKQLIAKQHDNSVLFNQFLELSNKVRIHPAYSMQQEVNTFEELLKEQEAYNLLLNFYSEHSEYYMEIYGAEKLNEFIAEVNKIYEKQHCQNRQVRGKLVLKSLEYQHENGKNISVAADELFNELETMLMQESNTFTKHELLLQLLKTGNLTINASTKLANYIDYLNDNIVDIANYNQIDYEFSYAILAKYNSLQPFDKRMEWINLAEASSKTKDHEGVFANYKLIKAIIAIDSNNFSLALKYLNEAEHQVHKMPGKSLATRNIWIEICHYKILLYLNAQLSGSILYDTTHYDILIRIVEDLGTHQYNQNVLLMDLMGFKAISANDFESALHYFQKSSEYRKKEDVNAHKLIADYIYFLLSGKTKKLNSTLIQLKQLNTPFLSKIGVKLLENLAVQYAVYNSSKLSEQEKHID
jgi:hypothetical protein